MSLLMDNISIFWVTEDKSTLYNSLIVFLFCFFRVADYEAKNKMGVSNLVSLFGPTMMTVDGDPVSVDLAS